MARRSYPSSTATAQTVVNLPDPITSAMVGGLDAAWRLGTSGHTGHVAIGMHSHGVGRFDGDLPPLQRFRGYVRVGHTIRAAQSAQFPSTSNPIDTNPMSVAAALGRLPVRSA